MIQIQKKQDCCGCHACAQICPKHCITMQPDAEGFLYPNIDESACIDCGSCEKVCPIIHSTREPSNRKPMAYAAMNLDENIRLASSSGGVFTLLAEQTIDKGGIVFGAAMSEDQHSVHHIAVETKTGLTALRGSKYLQSAIGDTYLQARKALWHGRKVLFSGTPCQIEGLRTFLQKDYPNLFCVDLICHGVPSPLVWDTYLTEQEKSAGAPARRTFFRHKKYGWKTFAVLLEFANNTAYERVASADTFMQAFLRNACLRPSCYACHFKKMNRVSDITLADYWGIQNQYPEMNDNKGISLVLVHSEKGQCCLNELGHFSHLKSVPVAQALINNPAMCCSVRAHKHRRQFFSHLGRMSFSKLVATYARDEIPIRRIILCYLKSIGLEPLIRALKNMKKKMRLHKDDA